MASIIKIADIAGIKETLLNFYKALRNFLATKTEMDVVATALTDLDRRIDEAMPTIEVGTVTTGSPGSSAQVTVSGSDKYVILNFSIPRGADGDMFHFQDLGYYATSGNISGKKVIDYGVVTLIWSLKQDSSITFTNTMYVPIPCRNAINRLADCISMGYTVELLSMENNNYKWKGLHWTLKNSDKEHIIYSTKYSTGYSNFYFAEKNGGYISALSIIDIVVRYENNITYVQVSIENGYGKAYYRGTIIGQKQI